MKYQLFLADEKEEEDLGFLLDLSEGGTEVESALSLLFDRFGGGEENDPEADRYRSPSSEKCKICWFKTFDNTQLLILILDIFIYEFGFWSLLALIDNIRFRVFSQNTLEEINTLVINCP